MGILNMSEDCSSMSVNKTATQKFNEFIKNLCDETFVSWVAIDELMSQLNVATYGSQPVGNQ
jgi:hypothetical protein